jgi:hypothetical protein
MSAIIPPDRPLSFRWWDEQSKREPERFLEHDFINQSRQHATNLVIELAQEFFGTVIEVGPGQGYDYEHYFRSAVEQGRLAYKGVEGSEGLRSALQQRFPEVPWQHGLLASLLPSSADVLYARHVFEHQADLASSMRAFLNAANHAAVICWYRPPSLTPKSEIWQDIPHQTWYRPDVFVCVERAGFEVALCDEMTQGDEVWVLRRKR